ncbi:MAG: SDR family NAD(P)-dependent oxidoreductase [Chloroflexi bacterium]|nr:SDR family NAD(P)-dependent oxidoreductase [Chloroflexota bacterium]
MIQQTNSKASGPTALVTGGAGFIGSHVCRQLLERGWQVRVLDDLSMGKRENVPDGAQLIVGDVRDPNTVRRTVAGVDVLFHLAAVVSIRVSVDEFYHDAEVNLLGTLNLLQACAERGIGKFVYASSMAVYADSPSPVPVTEDYRLSPISPYGIAKLTSENYVMQVGKQFLFDTVALRYFNTYGAGQTFTPYVGVITIFIRRLLERQAPVIFGDGEQRRDFVHVEDVAAATVAAAERDVSGTVINVGTGISTSVNQIAAMLGDKIAPGITSIHDAAQPGELRNSIADISRARQLLGYEPKRRLETDLDEVIAWNRERWI